MSYATMQDVLFDLELTDRKLQDRLRQYPDAADPELPKQRGEARRVIKLKAVAKPKAVKRRRAA